MGKNKLIVWIISLLMVILVACNANEQAQNNRNQNGMDNISSLQTDSNSDSYPHAQPVRVQEAKYEFKAVDEKQAKQHGIVEQQLRNIQQAQEQSQQPNAAQPQQQEQEQKQQQNKEQENTQQQPNTEQQQQQTEQPNQGQADQETQQQTTPSQTGNVDDFVRSVVELTNVERQNEGLAPLKMDTDLNQVAQVKSEDMQDKGYFSHTSPTYGSPFDMMRDFGVSYQSAAENIAHGQRSPEEVVDAWMNSEGHRANILDGKMTHIGVGVEKTGYHWTQMFIKK